MRCFRKPCLYLDCDLYDLLQLVEDNGSRSKMVRPAGVEPATYPLGGDCSIQLS